MPEYGVDLPLWDRSPQGIGPLEAGDLGISDQLTAQLRTWHTQWESHPPQEPRRWSAKEQDHWLATMYRLAWRLQAELAEVEVLIMDDRGREVPISERW
jgi:hypothetical protein